MPEARDQILYILTGPTAVGKTELSLAWAEKYRAEIISCDSLLFYRGMDIGTAKPTHLERQRVAHHMIDVCEVSERMDITLYVERARAAAREILSRGHRVLVVGGSGFYLKSFFAPIADDVAVPPSLRMEIEARLASDGLASLVDELRELNPSGIGKIDTENPRRVARALERCRASGRTLADLNEAFARLPKPFADWSVQLTCLDRPPAELAARATRRVQVMLDIGLVEEVRGLLASGLEGNPSASKAIGYRETIAYLQGELPREQLSATIGQNTRGLIKKQRTWFRTQLPPHRSLAANTAVVAELFEG
jgi:tRNA dimethylallyltransferase